MRSYDKHSYNLARAYSRDADDPRCGASHGPRWEFYHDEFRWSVSENEEAHVMTTHDRSGTNTVHFVKEITLSLMDCQILMKMAHPIIEYLRH